jgi:hypothetical protein
MALLFRNEYMIIKWCSSCSLLGVTWLQATECMSLLEYHQSLHSISKYFDSFQPDIFIFDAYNFNFRSTSDLNEFFFSLTQSIEHSEIVIISSHFFLGRYTISRITEKYSMIKVFETQADLTQWLKTKVS